MSAYSIRRVNATDIIADVQALMQEHWLETEAPYTHEPATPDRSIYEALEASNQLITLGAYYGDFLVGYATTLVATHIHYRGQVYAHNDAIFVHKDHRQSPLGIRLIRETEKIASASGAEFIFWAAKPLSHFDDLLKRIGGFHEENIYRKELPNG